MSLDLRFGYKVTNKDIIKICKKIVQTDPDYSDYSCYITDRSDLLIDEYLENKYDRDYCCTKMDENSWIIGYRICKLHVGVINEEVRWISESKNFIPILKKIYGELKISRYNKVTEPIYFSILDD